MQQFRAPFAHGVWAEAGDFCRLGDAEQQREASGHIAARGFVQCGEKVVGCDVIYIYMLILN